MPFIKMKRPLGMKKAGLNYEIAISVFEMGDCTEFLPFFKGKLVKGTSGIFICLPVWDFEFYKNSDSDERALEDMEDGKALLDAVDQGSGPP